MTTAFDTYINILLESHNIDNNKHKTPHDKYAELLQRLRPEDIEQGREWISDCQWSNLDPDDIKDLSNIEIVRGVARHYEGGWDSFLADGASV